MGRRCCCNNCPECTMGGNSAKCCQCTCIALCVTFTPGFDPLQHDGSWTMPPGYSLEYEQTFHGPQSTEIVLRDVYESLLPNAPIIKEWSGFVFPVHVRLYLHKTEEWDYEKEEWIKRCWLVLDGAPLWFKGKNSGGEEYEFQDRWEIVREGEKEEWLDAHPTEEMARTCTDIIGTAYYAGTAENGVYTVGSAGKLEFHCVDWWTPGSCTSCECLCRCICIEVQKWWSDDYVQVFRGELCIPEYEPEYPDEPSANRYEGIITFGSPFDSDYEELYAVVEIERWDMWCDARELDFDYDESHSDNCMPSITVDDFPPSDSGITNWDKGGTWATDDMLWVPVIGDSTNDGYLNRHHRYEHTYNQEKGMPWGWMKPIVAGGQWRVMVCWPDIDQCHGDVEYAGYAVRNSDNKRRLSFVTTIRQLGHPDVEPDENGLIWKEIGVITVPDSQFDPDWGLLLLARQVNLPEEEPSQEDRQYIIADAVKFSYIDARCMIGLSLFNVTDGARGNERLTDPMLEWHLMSDDPALPCYTYNMDYRWDFPGSPPTWIDPDYDDDADVCTETMTKSAWNASYPWGWIVFGTEDIQASGPAELTVNANWCSNSFGFSGTWSGVLSGINCSGTMSGSGVIVRNEGDRFMVTNGSLTVSSPPLGTTAWTGRID